MTIHSGILAWEISWTEEPGRLQLMGSQRGGHNLATKQQIYIYIFLYTCSNNRYIYSYTYSLLQTLFHFKLLQDIRYNSLCYAVDRCFLFHV